MSSASDPASAMSATSPATAGDAEPTLAVEFLVEPFSEGDPGTHVQAAVGAFERRELEVDLGPFASVVSGDPDTIADAVAEMIREAMAAGATSLRMHIGPDAKGLSVGPLHDALKSMIRAAERDIGAKVDDWTRADKQRVVRLLEDQGAFLLRGAVDDMARIMGVSRITIYNYLNAIDRSAP
ncbi:MAG: helix-turn-helix domain-containing protein [Actinomycetota bacterium]